MNLADKKILITGGSKGIGKGFVSACIEEGATQIAVMARNEEKLKELEREFSQIELLLLPGDISKPAVLDAAVVEIRDSFGGLDILINNAGVVSAGQLEEMSDADVIDQISINLTAQILVTKKFLPLLKDSAEAGIINVSSGLGWIAMPFYSVYAAAKAGLRQFGDGLHRELADYPIHVLTTFPTVTDTPMMEGAKVSKKMDDPLFVARKTLEGLKTGERQVIFGGNEREQDIEDNFLHPEKIDQKAREKSDELKERAANHRSM